MVRQIRQDWGPYTQLQEAEHPFRSSNPFQEEVEVSCRGSATNRRVLQKALSSWVERFGQAILHPKDAQLEKVPPGKTH